MTMDQIKEELDNTTQQMNKLDAYMTKEFNDWRNTFFFAGLEEKDEYMRLARYEKILKELIDRYDNDTPHIYNTI